MGAPVVHFEINTKDGKSLLPFYEQAFGWKTEWQDQMTYGVVDTDSGGRGIGGGIGTAREGRWIGIYIEVPDTDAALRTIERLGGTTVTPTTAIPGVVTFAVFEDPQGNRIGLVKAE